MSEWPRLRLRDIATIQSGGTPSTDEPTYWGGEIPWITPGELTGRDRRYVTTTDQYITRRGLASSGATIVPVGSLLVTTRATLDARSVTQVPIATNQGFKNLVFDSKVADVGFYYHLFGLLKSEMTRRASGTTFLEVSAKEFGNIEVPVPPLSEQKRIMEILDSIDEQINAEQCALKKHESTAVALGVSLIPVVPDPRRLDSGWDLVQLISVVPTVEYGISTPLGTGSGIPVLRMNNLLHGRILLGDLKVATEAVPRNLILKDRDVLFNRTNSFEHVGRTSTWRGDLDKATFASYLVRLNPDRSRLTPEYLVRWLNQRAIQQRIRRIATPAVQQVNINPTALRKIPIELPSDLSHQHQITKILDDADSAIDASKKSLEKLWLQKQGTMDDLLNGRVRVNPAAN